MGKIYANDLILILAIVIVILFIAKRKSSLTQVKSNSKQRHSNSSEIESNTFEELLIPDHCPHCKNPNTKKIRLCEWCGNQIV